MTKRIGLYLIPFISVFVILFSACTNEEGLVAEDPDNTPENIIIKSNDFLSESKYVKLVIEITAVQGFEPSAEAVNNLKVFLENLLNKSGGITIVSNSIASPEKESYSLADIKEIEENCRTSYPEGKTLTAWFFFADADYAGNEDDSKVLGIAYTSTSMAVFEKTIDEFSGGFWKPSTKILEETVMKHEFGHILGLVNNGTDMVENHQDTSHGSHCNNEDCLMYYAAEHSSGVVRFLRGGEVPSLDASCLVDLKNNGGK
ncbi:zinc metalloprotease [Maribellus maritimus]|uniref:hypothetical protein n=1 Tax=Maribellus maritimus TaxID=2870838 RepID=UPI001EEBEBDC|nr:hypothetical protein [Maribellus maritimus]MCG6188526.1 hypothetical protein [Maribellus maritimus]